MNDADRELMRMLAGEMQALRESNLESHVVAGSLGERIDGIAERLAAQLVVIDERLDRIERAHAERLADHSTDIGAAIERVAAIERGVAWTKAWAAGAGAASVALLSALWWTVSQIPPGAWSALQKLGGK